MEGEVFSKDSIGGRFTACERPVCFHNRSPKTTLSPAPCLMTCLHHSLHIFKVNDALCPGSEATDVQVLPWRDAGVMGRLGRKLKDQFVSG